ncbi:PilT/PilU family type 4a pilus ATPase [Neobittarella massiliensis]|uniref:PilT/PilU family type 4a pilus ATPase n=1 Tax=Neobittarella massiliensis (ex Bilen et al. 2018) TaxID=2041842 RepID=A0A8J6LZP0_9FIRM|nr:PilT/PilU family type 4a pilus ATPase [Neobittarella massiliensis]MBC3517157.1 PilT/PilU family type 4a pilus ATPase [Neobittarella massiliensis]
MELIDILKQAAAKHASDIFIIAGLPLSYKINNHITRMETERLTPQQTQELVMGIYYLAEGRDPAALQQRGDDDFSFSLVGVSRFRVSVYKQRGSLAAVIRVVAFSLPDPAQIGIPEQVLALGQKMKGLVLITGSAGSGKSTTLACIIDRINQTRNAHVITLEDPLEYLHRHSKSIISQREISTDTSSYVVALRAALRQAPDVILLGEMRDYETINVAMTAAETGHLVLSTLHTVGAANSVDRIIDVFPVQQQAQVRVQLSMVLEAVVSQQLVPTVDERVQPAFEIMMCNSAIRNMIRESKIHQIDSVIAAGGGSGMRSMNGSLLELQKQGIIDARTAVEYSLTPDLMAKRLGL